MSDAERNAGHYFPAEARQPLPRSPEDPALQEASAQDLSEPLAWAPSADKAQGACSVEGAVHPLGSGFGDGLSPGRWGSVPIRGAQCQSGGEQCAHSPAAA